MPASFVPQVDDGTAVGANAYIDLPFYRQYHLDRGRDFTATADATIQKGIVLATDYIDLRWHTRFAGRKLNTAGDFSQATQWPREEIGAAFNRFGIRYFDFATGLPAQLQKACAEYALRATTNPLLIDGITPIVDGVRVPTGEIKSTSVTVGPIKDATTYGDDTGGDSYGTGTVLINGCYFITIPAADLLIEQILGQGTVQRRASR